MKKSLKLFVKMDFIAVKLLMNIFQSTYEKIKQNSLELIFENITTTNYKESSDPFS